MGVLCVSRQFSCGAEDISRRVAEQMGYEYVDKARLAHDLGALGEQWKDLLRDRDESCPTIWERYDKGYKAMLSLVEAKIFEYASRDSVVLVGRGSHIVLGGLDPVLRVRLFAPEWKRVEMLMQSDEIDRTTAEWLIEKMDHEKACYIQANYGRPLDNSADFDLIFDISEHSREYVVAELCGALRRKDQTTPQEAWERLRTLALGALVKAKIATDPRVFIPTLEVREEGGALVLVGVVHSEKEMKLAVEIAKGAAGTIPVLNRLRFRIAGPIH